MSLAGAMGGHTVVRQAPARPTAPRSRRHRYLPAMATGELRATMALTEPGGGSDLQAITDRRAPRRRRLRHQRDQDLDHQRPPLRADRPAVQDRPGGQPRPTGHQHPARRERPGLHRLPRPAQARLQGRRELRASFRRLRVPAAALLGGERGQGFAQMMRGLEIGRIQVASRALGVGPGRPRGLRFATHSNERPSASRSGSTSRSATTWPTWRRS